MNDPIDINAIFKVHRLAELGDYDAGHNVCHHCGDEWPCDAAKAANEVKRLQIENGKLREQIARLQAERSCVDCCSATIATCQRSTCPEHTHTENSADGS